MLVRYAATAVVVCVVAVPGLWGQEALPRDATLASVAHSHGVRGGDLAEALGFERATDKNRPLVEMGVTADGLRVALQKLGAQPMATSGGERAQRAHGDPADLGSSGRQGEGARPRSGSEYGGGQGHPGRRLGVTQPQLGRALAHGAGHRALVASQWKYPIFALLVLFAMLYLLRLGIPRAADPRHRRGYYPNWVYLVCLAFSVVVLGFLLGKSPNPMESVVKVFKADVGLYEAVGPYLLWLGLFLVLAIVANKAICGWACPFGALEELLYTLPLFRRAKRWKPPFWVTNAVRIALFVLFLLLIFGVVGGRKGFVVYHYANPFNLFNLDFTIRTVPWFLGAYLVLSFLFYRPFCRFVCPFGLVSWVIERMSLTRVRIDRERCTNCQACARACPLTAASDRLAGKPLPADCFSCMRCLRVCPADAIHYRPAWGPASPARPEAETSDAA